MSSRAVGPEKSRVFTFYSYKGGVGRTMAVANLACWLAHRHGLKVACIDWDLEAPGLHYYLGWPDEELRTRSGLVEYLHDFRSEVRHGATGVAPNVCEYLLPPAERIAAQIKFGEVRLLHCGRTDPLYLHRVKELDWKRFYEEEQGFSIVQTLRLQLLDSFDVVLIDARAGQADVGVTPTVQLPDTVVLLFTSNRQSLEGSIQIARRLIAHPLRRDQEIGPPHLLFTPARVFPAVDAYATWLNQDVRPALATLRETGMLLPEDISEDLLREGLPVAPHASVDEQIVVFDESPRVRELTHAYRNLAQALANLHQGLNAWTMEKPDADSERLSLDALKKQIAEASQRGDSDKVAQLQWLAGKKATEDRRVDEAEAFLQAAIAFYAGRGSAYAAEYGFSLLALGDLRVQQLKEAEAMLLYEKALTLLRETEEKSGQGLILLAMGNLRAKEGAYPEALRLYEEAQILLRESGTKNGQSVALHMMANALAKAGHPAQALTMYEEALILDREQENKRGQSAALHAMGNLTAEMGGNADAIPLYEEALVLDREMGDKLGQGMTLHGMGNVRAKQGDLTDALRLYEEALVLKRDAGDKRGQGVTLHAMGNARVQQADHAEALRLYEEALALKREAGDKLGQGVTLHEMGNVRAQQGDHADALRLYEEALALDREAGDKRGQGVMLHAMGNLRAQKGEHVEALRLYEEALALAQEAGDQEGIGIVSASIAQLRSKSAPGREQGLQGA